MTKKTYKEDKKKLKEFFKNEEFNLKKVFDDLLNTLDPTRRRIIEKRYKLRNTSFPGYEDIEEVPWSHVSKSENYSSSQWVRTLFWRSISQMKNSNYFKRDDHRKKLRKIKKELIKYVDKENINDKSVYLYITKYFLFEDTLYQWVIGKGVSLRGYFLYR